MGVNGLMITMPILAMLIIPMNWTWHILGVNFKPWRLYLACNSLINLWNGIVFSILPESPKFLLSMNQKEEALQVLRGVYAFNTGQSEEVICGFRFFASGPNFINSAISKLWKFWIVHEIGARTFCMTDIDPKNQLIIELMNYILFL